MTESIQTEVNYTRELACKFWLDFDRPFNGAFKEPSDEMRNLLQMSVNILSKYQQYYDTDTKNVDEIGFRNEIENMQIRQDVLNLANAQFDIINCHFKDKNGDLNLGNLKKAFEDFGQGVLYDPHHDDERTVLDTLGNPRIDEETGNKMIFRIHKMDSIGQWTWWHSFIRAAGIIFPNESKYFELDKLIAYSCIINYIVQPKQSYQFPNGQVPVDSIQNPIGPGSPEALEEAKFILRSKAFEELDKIIEIYDVSQT